MSSTPPELTESLPQSLLEAVEHYWQDWCLACEAADIKPDIAYPLSRVGTVWACSEFVARLCIRRPAVFLEILADIESNSSLEDYKARVAQAIAGVPENDANHIALMEALRLLRQREMLRIAWRDLDNIAELKQVLHELSDFAEAVVSESLDYLHKLSVAVLGNPVSKDGQSQTMLVLAMGKLGGRELNFSSDIDLIFAYDEDGETVGGRKISNHEYFLRLGRIFVKVLNEATQEGFVFRVDTRLRPYGDSGPLVMSFAAMEEYYQSQGRDWERYAMIKARVIAGSSDDALQLDSMLKPFIYRRYLDYAAFESIREMKMMIESEVKRKGIKDNIKLGRGGIREIEFIGQTFQLLRGGHDTSLQTRGIIDVIQLLVKIHCLDVSESDQLISSYQFLRRLENRIQMEKDRQAHSLPVDDYTRQVLSLAMGCADWSSLQSLISSHRENVHRIFRTIVSHDTDAAGVEEVEAVKKDDQLLSIHQVLKAYWLQQEEESHILQWLEANSYSKAADVLQQLNTFRNGPRIVTLSETATQRLLQLLTQLLIHISKHTEPEILFERILGILNAIVGRQVYINLLLEYPEVMKQMLSLCSTSDWFVKQIIANPLILDELLDANELYRTSNRESLTKELDYLMLSVPEDDLEQSMDRLRQFRNAQVLKTAVLDVNQIISVTDVGDTLSYIAEVVLEKVLTLAWRAIVQKHGVPTCQTSAGDFRPGLAIIAYGKLGGLELGYSSDLDIVFLHNSAGEQQVTDGEQSIDNQSFFSRVAQKVLHILGTRTYAGLLYETDIRLRPEGRAGLMVSSVTAFEQYQRENAWIWEHQALLRARIVAGNNHVSQEFDRIRRSVLSAGYEDAKLREEVVKMRLKMREHLGTRPGQAIDLKQDSGGIVDIEFITQAGALLNAKQHPDLLNTSSTLVYLRGLADCGWLSDDEATDLSAAYRDFRQQMNLKALLVEPDEALNHQLQQHRDKVIAVWNRLMPE